VSWLDSTQGTPLLLFGYTLGRAQELQRLVHLSSRDLLYVTLTCPCGLEGHADLIASETFLRRHEADVPRPIARPVCLMGLPPVVASPRAHRPNEEHTRSQVTAGDSA